MCYAFSLRWFVSPRIADVCYFLGLSYTVSWLLFVITMGLSHLPCVLPLGVFCADLYRIPVHSFYLYLLIFLLTPISIWKKLKNWYVYLTIPVRMFLFCISDSVNLLLILFGVLGKFA